MLSVLIVHYNRQDLLVECLLSLKGAEDVVVVDNGSLTQAEQDDLKSRFKEVSWLFLSENLGFSAGVNRAAEVARGDVYFLLNPDTTLHDVSLPDVEAMFAREGADIVGLAQTDEQGRPQLSTGWGATIPEELFRKILQDGCDTQRSWACWALSRLQKDSHSVQWVAGSALVTSRACFETINGFDEGYFLYFEDIDYCYRVRDGGGRVAYSQAFTLIHHRGACAATVPQAAQAHYRDSQIRFFREHGVGLAKHLLPAWGRLRKRLKP